MPGSADGELEVFCDSDTLGKDDGELDGCTEFSMLGNQMVN